MDTIAHRELRNNSSAVLARVAAGEAIAVTNHGPAIPAGSEAAMFDPLKRGATAAATGETTSMGLGLFIVREIVLAHGGTITVESSMAAGTVFTIRLPRVPA